MIGVTNSIIQKTYKDHTDSHTILLITNELEDLSEYHHRVYFTYNWNIFQNAPSVSPVGDTAFYINSRNGCRLLVDKINMPEWTASDFTLEWWECAAARNNDDAIFGLNASGSDEQNGLMISQRTCWAGGSGWSTYSSWVVWPTPVAANTWCHKAMVREGMNWYTYIDGVRVSSRTVNTTANPLFTKTVPLCWGGWTRASGSYQWYGWFRNMRISNIARYTGENFTVPIHY